ncbi:unnamed protein product [Rotaria sordida]|uniref:Domain of unknown function with conserved HDNR motif domain-containing protein n=1 Tax=Rotaria sordida TaxID=392033 RepID=A0A814YES2_9BILA|nr:unnamed protein product [Rotaria sordida]CAF1227819.1 unnamed protein product [Rotaria sordida]CAF1351269.1 unnamed protein product [Rotaria sordida]CAF3763394.1 unnamed protein product [Rotaria sordida]
MNLKPAGYWFKQRGYTDSSFDRQLATTTGEMLNQIVDSKQPSVTSSNNLLSTTSSVNNRRHPNISNRISDHDNRNLIQNYGEYFGRGFGKRLVSQTPVYNHDWIFLNEPRPAHPDRGLTQHDYRGLPPLENPQSSSIITKNSKKSNKHWMTSCYDDFGGDTERVPSELIYRHDYKRMPIYPWHY